MCYSVILQATSLHYLSLTHKLLDDENPKIYVQSSDRHSRKTNFHELHAVLIKQNSVLRHTRDNRDLNAIQQPKIPGYVATSS